MNTSPDSRRQDIMRTTQHALALEETRALTRATLDTGLQTIDPRAEALAQVRGDMAMVLNVDAHRDPQAEAIERILAVNKLLTVVGRKKQVVGSSRLGRTVIENKGNGQLRIMVTGGSLDYDFTVDSEGNVEGGSFSAETALVGAGRMEPGTLVDVVNTLKNLVASN